MCIGDSINLSAAVIGGTPGYRYSWGNGIGLGQPSPNVSPDTTINYFVTVTDANNCSASDSVNITVYPVLNLSLSFNTTICSGEQGSLSAIAAGGDGGSYS